MSIISKFPLLKPWLDRPDRVVTSNKYFPPDLIKKTLAMEYKTISPIID